MVKIGRQLHTSLCKTRRIDLKTSDRLIRELGETQLRFAKLYQWDILIKLLESIRPYRFPVTDTKNISC